MQITEKEKKAIDDAVQDLHYVSTDDSGNKYIELYADYRDTNEGLLEPAYKSRRIGFDSKDNEAYAMEDTLRETIYEWYREEIWRTEDQILEHAGIERLGVRADICLDYLRETYPVEPDYDHFLKQDMRVNFMLKAGDEGNRDFIGIHEQRLAFLAEDWTPAEREEALKEKTGLSWLVEQQGHTMEELGKTLHEYIDFFTAQENQSLKYDQKYARFRGSHNPFLTSLCQELENMPNYMNTVTVLAAISMTDFAAFMQPGKELVLPQNAEIGIFNPWNGGGSTLEIELEKELVIPSELLYDIQIEGAKLDYGYTVNNVYGLIGSAWKPIQGVRDQKGPEAPEKHKPSLTDRITAAAEKAAQNRPEAPTAFLSGHEQGRG